MPDPAQLAKEAKGRQRGKLEGEGAAAARLRGSAAAVEGEGKRRAGAAVGTAGVDEEEAMIGVRDCGWKEGACFAGIDVGVLSGSALSTFRRYMPFWFALSGGGKGRSA